ncbi:MAG: hypothetical protein QNK68_00985 [Flavobacteriales bacterium]|tara:strand:+ start:4150 stop:4845 length:696 start_codon:yes stop_codon:yes gene_type:complete
MKLNFFTNVKLGAFALLTLTAGLVQAQQITGDIAREAVIVPGTTSIDGAVKVIDNKGTIKYLQVQNGITTLSNTTNDVTTTTWQLGGTLTDSTWIDVDTKVFGLDGIDLINTEIASTDATTGSDHGTGSGYTLLVRDEATGAIKKLLATDLIQSGHQVYTATADQTTYTINSGGTPLPDFSKVFVFRNGAKLVANLDYTISGDDVTLVPATTGNNIWAVYADDTIEVQFVK